MIAGVGASRAEATHRRFPAYGWAALSLVAISWWLNWGLDGLRTHWAFFLLWAGYCLLVDALVRWRTGTSLLTRSRPRYAGLFLLSAPAWWLFEVLNLRTQNWIYLGLEHFTPGASAFWTTLNFTTVIPAVLGSAELIASFGFMRRLPAGPRIRPDRLTTAAFFSAGWIGLALLLVWPRVFFPFVWISLYFIVEPLNIWMGNRSLADWTRTGNWRPVVALWAGVLLTAFFWEMWNFFSYPKWVYDVPWGNWLHVFEMPLLGYGGYLPFALELFALYHFVIGLLGQNRPDYVRVVAE
jgi:hypothetical protein